MANIESTPETFIPPEEEVLIIDVAIDPIDLAIAALAKLKAAGHNGVIIDEPKITSQTSNVIQISDFRHESLIENDETAVDKVEAEPVIPKKFFDPRPGVRTIRETKVPQEALTMQEALDILVPEQGNDRLKILEANAVKLIAELKQTPKATDNQARRVVLISRSREILKDLPSDVHKEFFDQAVRDLKGEYLRTLDGVIYDLAVKSQTNGHSLSVNDLKAEAQLGALEGLSRFDLSTRGSVLSFIYHHMQGRIIDAIREKGTLVRLSRIDLRLDRELDKHENSIRAGLVSKMAPDDLEKARAARERLANFRIASLDEVYNGHDDDGLTLLDTLSAQESQELEEESIDEADNLDIDVQGLLARLPERSAEVVRLRFGLPPYEKEHTMQQIGDMFGLTESRISQLLSKSLRILSTQKRVHEPVAPKKELYVKEKTIRRPQLTPSELKNLLLACEGLTCEATAKSLSRSINTVNSHRRNILMKLQASNINNAVLVAYREGWLPERTVNTERDLSERETEVLQVIAEVGTYSATAKALFLSPHTVNSYIKKILKALKASTTTQAVYKACQLGLVK